ncbi:MAG: gliding motility protein GldN [Chitinophagaceae bacterium]
MKKYQLYFGLAFASMMWVNLAQAQFNYAAKKKPATAAKDSVAPKTDNTPAAVTPTAPVVVNPNAKSVKTYDTTLVGGFNDKKQKPQRNNYAFFSENSKRKGVQEKIPLPYENLREEDALFSEFLWEEIDGREKLNRPFTYQAYDDNGDQRFFALLLRAIDKQEVVPFSAAGGDDRFTQPISSDEVSSMLKGSLDTQLVQNVDNPNIYDTSIIYNTKLAPNPDSIYTFRLKEQWIFDKKTSRMYCRIIGIAPVATLVINNKPTKRTLFWLYYPELRTTLAKAEVYNPKNISSRITWEELFESRYFNSYIVKSSIDNFNDKLLNAIYKDPIRRLQEGEKIRQKIFDYEQDRWVY